MASRSPTLTWNLDQTADGVISITKKFLRVVTDDNIQAVVLLACPKFGACVAISPAARDVISKLSKESANPIYIQYLKSVINYSQNDSFSLLESSVGGQNFLALAAILTSTMTNFDASLVMEKMVTASAGDRSLVPGANHLKALFDILEPKLNRAGFLDHVLSWKHQWSIDGAVSDAGRLLLQHAGDSFPDADGIHQLVRAFAIVNRVGDEDAKRVVITARVCVPWLAAFAMWSIGVSPTRHTTNGKVIAEEPSSPVTIIFAESELFGNLNIEIEVVSSSRSFVDVVPAKVANSQSPFGAVGMTDIGVYAQQMLQHQNLLSSFGFRTLKQALPLALKQVRDLCFAEGRSAEPSDQSKVLPLIGNPFPPEDVISRTAVRYIIPRASKPRHFPAPSVSYIVNAPDPDLSSDAEQIITADSRLYTSTGPESPYLNDLELFVLKALEPGLLLSDVPIVKTWTEGNPGGSFSKAISPIVADILALSLFDSCLDSMLVYYCRNRKLGNRSMRVWEYTVQRILETGAPQKCDIRTILAFTLGLVRHEVSSNEWKWVASSFRGQVIFPRVFEDNTLQQEGYLELLCFPGILEPEGAKRPFNLVRPQVQHLVICNDDFLSNRITSIVNWYQDHQLLWHTSAREDCLQIGMGWTKSQTSLDPFNILQTLAHALFATCSHDPDTHRDNLPDCHCRSPVDDQLHGKQYASESEITVFPVANDPGLSMLALSSIAWRTVAYRAGDPVVIINQGACLDCLISFCHLFACRCLIL
jgi:hypothetical protein